MDGDNAIPSLGKEHQKWDHPWKTNEIRKHSANWTLAGDIGLLNHLQEFSQQLISRTHEMEKLVDDLVHNTKKACARVNNVINDFQMLSNIQFVENRVYDEEVEEQIAVESNIELQKTKEQREAEMLPRVKQALELGLSVLDEAFHKIQVDETSDSEEEERGPEGHMVLEPKDPYENRPLPYTIGSEEFLNDDYVGLRDLCEEDTVEISAEDESVSVTPSTSSEESEEEFKESSMLNNTQPEKRTERIPNRNYAIEKSDSESSDLFELGGDENGYITPSESFEEEKEKNKEQKSVAVNLNAVVKEVKALSSQKTASIPENITENQVHKTDDVEKHNDLFAPTEDDSIFDEDSPFQKKSGLFSVDTTFKTEKDEIFVDDLFGSHKEETTRIPDLKKVEKGVPPQRPKKDSILFDDDDEMEQDIFSTYTKSTKPFSYRKQENVIAKGGKDAFSKNTGLVDSSASQSNTGSSGILGGLNGRINSPSLFEDDSDSDDLFSTKSKSASTTDYGFDDDSLFRTSKKKTSELRENRKETSTKILSSTKKGLQPSLFDDETLDLFSPSNANLTKIIDIEKGSPQEIQSSKDFTFSTPVKSLESLSVENKDKLSQESTKAKELLNIPTEERETFSSQIKDQIQHSFGFEETVSNASGDDHISLTKKYMSSVTTDTTDSFVGFDNAVNCPNTLNAINKDRAKIPGKRRKPTRKGRQAALQIVDSENEDKPSADSPDPSQTDVETPNTLSSLNVLPSNEQPLYSPQKRITKPQYFGMDKNVMSQLVSEISTSKIGKSNSVKLGSDDTSDNDLFSVNKDTSPTPSSSFLSPSKGSIESNVTLSKPVSEKANKSDFLDVFGTDTFLDDDLFSDSAFKDIKMDITENKPFLLMDDDEDDIFKPIKNVSLESSFPSSKSADSIFDEPGDIFAGVEEQKYNIAPSLIYDDDDDIFGNYDVHHKLPAESSSIKKKAIKNDTAGTVPVDNIFEDPLSVMLSGE